MSMEVGKVVRVKGHMEGRGSVNQLWVFVKLLCIRSGTYQTANGASCCSWIHAWISLKGQSATGCSIEEGVSPQYTPASNARM